MTATRTRTLKERFHELYGEDCRVFRAPGRVNLIGEHTDYNDGFVMPAALDFSTWVAAAPRQDGRLVMRSGNFEESVSFAVEDATHPEGHHWSDYIRGVALAMRAAGFPLSGATLLVLGEVPIGAGLSSSAALEVSSALALLALNGHSLDPKEVARLCQRAENEFVGMRCGIMDQFISCCGKAGHALMLDCRSLDYRLLPVSTQLVIVNSMVKHELAGGEYNERREACEEGARLLGLKALRDATLDQIERLPVALQKRCRHVVSENRRVEEAAQALQDGDLQRFGQLMGESHRSLRDDFEVSCPELDKLVELAAVDGVYGARMTGGGFGGCTINLVRADRVDAFVSHIRAAYAPVIGREPDVYVCTASQGAQEV